jgi:hypothetical protein
MGTDEYYCHKNPILIKNNKNIIEKFNDYYIIDNEQKNVFLVCRKGFVNVYVISDKNYKEYDYWSVSGDGELSKYPYEYDLGDFSGCGTVEIIKEIINFFQHKKSQYECSSKSPFIMKRLIAQKQVNLHDMLKNIKGKRENLKKLKKLKEV